MYRPVIPKPRPGRTYLVRCELAGAYNGDAAFTLEVADCLDEAQARIRAQETLDAQRPVFPWRISGITEGQGRARQSPRPEPAEIEPNDSEQDESVEDEDHNP